MPACSRSASTCSSGSSTSRMRAVPPRASSSASSALGEVEHRPGLHAEATPARASSGSVSKESWSDASASPPPSSRLRKRGTRSLEVEGALPGQHEVRRQRGVAGEPRQRPAPARAARARALGVVHGLGPGGVGEPAPRARPRPPAAGSRPATTPRLRRAPRRRTTSTSPVPRPHRPSSDEADAHARRCVLVEPGAEPAGPGVVDLDVLGRACGCGVVAVQGEEPLAEHPELQGVEDLVHGVAVEAAGARGLRARAAGGRRGPAR